jgi:predicted enzyme related to lactoylglutathione lyase
VIRSITIDHVMKARSFSHVGITVSDFNRAVRFY